MKDLSAESSTRAPRSEFTAYTTLRSSSGWDKPHKRLNKRHRNIACNFNAPTGLHILAQGKRKRHPGFWRTKFIALKGLHRNCTVFAVAFCIRVLCNPFRVLRKNYGIHTQGGASAYPGLYYSALSGHNTTILKHFRKLKSFMYGFLFKRLWG